MVELEQLTFVQGGGLVGVKSGMVRVIPIEEPKLVDERTSIFSRAPKGANAYVAGEMERKDGDFHTLAVQYYRILD